MRKTREQRKFERVPFREEVVVVVEGENERLVGETRDISIGCVFVEHVSAAFGKRVTVHLTPSGAFESIRLLGVVRWVGRDGIGIQFGLLGARETHLITQIVGAKGTA